jgi:predicted nucleic acid-binding protein
LKYLLDASALLPLITRRGKGLLTEVSREYLITTDMAVYEACNSLWKLVTLLRSVSLEDAVTAATVLKSLTAREMIHLSNFVDLNLTKTLEKACEDKLTFYDASYIVAAEDTEATLVTEDKKLQKKACKSIKTMTYRDLENELNKG